MISSLETGAIFKIIDEASPALIKISDGLKEMQGLVDRDERIVHSAGEEQLRAASRGRSTGWRRALARLRVRRPGLLGTSTKQWGRLQDR